MKSHFEPPRQLPIDFGRTHCRSCGRPPEKTGRDGGGGYSGGNCKACSIIERLSGDERNGKPLKINPLVMRTVRNYWDAKTCEAIRRDKALRERGNG